MTGRALVLSGGGPVGIAWETGIVAGLAEGGVHLGLADLIVGTSAGSVVGAQLALGRDPQDMLAAQMARAQGPAAGQQRPPGPAPDLTPLMQLMGRALDPSLPLEQRLAEVGKLALSAKTADEESFIAGFGRQLSGSDAWPEKDFRCTAIEAVSGQFVIWDRGSGVPLARAVASSCAVPGIFPPITINGRRYYDGGIRSASNADLAKGSETVVILSLSGAADSADPRAQRVRERLQHEVTVLKEHGAGQVELITPDEEARRAFGPNPMDSRRNAGAAENGLRQGRTQAGRLKAIWG